MIARWNRDPVPTEAMSPREQHSRLTYYFDDVAVDCSNFRVLKRGKAKAVEPRAFDVLSYLIEHRGRTVEKQELFEEVWKGTFVTDGALTRIVKEIRHLIGDDASSPRYLETVPKRGYRFIASVEEVPSAAEEAPEQGTVEPIDSLAVLPFANLNADPEQDYFVEGITDLLITDLGKIGALKVISRTSVMPYKQARKPLPQIAQELKVKAVVEGSVLRVGECVRITVQLIEAATDRHLWAESYERDLHDVLALQSEVAQAIAREIQVALTPEEKVRLASAHQVNPQAHLAYLKGHYFLEKYSPDSIMKAVECFQLAIERDANYAAAYTGLAYVYGVLVMAGFAPPRETIPKARAAVLKAIEIDDTLGEAHSVLGRVKFFNEWDWVAAEREFKRAIELNPSDALGRLFYSFDLAVMGRLDEGMAEIRRAWELDPLSLFVNTIVGWHFYVQRHYEQAIEQWQTTLEMEPDFFAAHWTLWRVYRFKGRYEEALEECRKTFSLRANSEVVEAIELGYAESGYGGAMRRAARTLVAQSKARYVLPTDIAMFYTHAEEKDLALQWLEKAYEERDPWLHALGVEPDWESLRPDARFQALLRRLGLPESNPSNAVYSHQRTGSNDASGVPSHHFLRKISD